MLILNNSILNNLYESIQSENKFNNFKKFFKISDKDFTILLKNIAKNF